MLNVSLSKIREHTGPSSLSMGSSEAQLEALMGKAHSDLSIVMILVCAQTWVTVHKEEYGQDGDFFSPTLGCHGVSV